MGSPREVEDKKFVVPSKSPELIRKQEKKMVRKRYGTVLAKPKKPLPEEVCHVNPLTLRLKTDLDIPTNKHQPNAMNLLSNQQDSCEFNTP